MPKKAKRPISSLGQIISRNVRIYRVVAALSQEELAERCGLKRTYIGSIERAEIDFRVSMLERIANGLDIEPARLLSDAGVKLRGK